MNIPHMMTALCCSVAVLLGTMSADACSCNQNQPRSVVSAPVVSVAPTVSASPVSTAVSYTPPSYSTFPSATTLSAIPSSSTIQTVSYLSTPASVPTFATYDPLPVSTTLSVPIRVSRPIGETVEALSTTPITTYYSAPVRTSIEEASNSICSPSSTISISTVPAATIPAATVSSTIISSPTTISVSRISAATTISSTSETISKPLTSLKVSPDVVLPVASDTVSIAATTKSVSPRDSVAATVLNAEKPLSKKELPATASDSSATAIPAVKKELAAKPVAEMPNGSEPQEKSPSKKDDAGVVLIPHPAAGATKTPTISDAEVDAMKNAIASSIENSAGKKQFDPKAKTAAKPVDETKSADATKPFDDIVATEKVPLKPLARRGDDTTALMLPGIPATAPMPDADSIPTLKPEPSQPVPMLPTPPPPMVPELLAKPSETATTETVAVDSKPTTMDDNSIVSVSVAKPALPELTPKSDISDHAVETVRGQAPSYSPLDDIGSRPPNPQGVIADPSALPEKLTESPKPDPALAMDSLFDNPPITTPGTVARPPQPLKAQQWTNSILLITTLGALGALIYALAMAFDYHSRWMQSLTTQNNRLSFTFDGAAEGLAPTEDTDLYVDPYINPYGGYPRFSDPLDVTKAY